jgi:hypothetical protein
MATAAENLQTAYDNYAEQLASISNPAAQKLTYSIDGQSVSWTEYQQFLVGTLKDLRAQIVAASGPFMVRSRGRG